MGNSGPLERAQLANPIQGFRIPDRSDAWENNNFLGNSMIYSDSEHKYHY